MEVDGGSLSAAVITVLHQSEPPKVTKPSTKPNDRTTTPQACIGGKIIASEQIAPYRKDVLAKC